MKAIFWLSVLTPFLDKAALAADNIACPEQIGAELQACQNCGNEDPNSQGHCVNVAYDGSHCSCNSASVTIPLETTIVTAAASGATSNVTGTYALATLTAYSNLRQSITTTVTSTPTQVGQPIATAAVVIFAGGVAWYLAGVVGGEAAILTTPNEAGGHPDDAQCPNPKSKCSECGGVNGICVLSNGGCTCEDSEATCPQEKPDCDAETCQGSENNQCTVENKGCDCERTRPSCPDPTEALFCSQCGGEDSDMSKCSDGAPCCTGPENQGCPCYQAENPNIFGYENPTDLGLVHQWWDQLQNGAHNQPTCNGVSTVDPGFFESIYHQFCVVANDGNSHDWTHTMPSDAPKHAGFQFKFKASGGGTCRSCEGACTQIMKSCTDSTKSMANTGSIDIGCGSYSYEIQVPPKSAPPPPSAPATATCMYLPPLPDSGSSNITVTFKNASPDQILAFQQKVGCERGGREAPCALQPEKCSVSTASDFVGITIINYLQSGGAATLPSVSCAKFSIQSVIGQEVECTRGPS